MENLVRDDIVKFGGVSNFNLKELQEAEHVLENDRIVCNQVLYHLFYRAIEKRYVHTVQSKE
jgi:diketogulonate reductase-like aldo/keto reductase